MRPFRQWQKWQQSNIAELHLGLSHWEQKLRWETEESPQNYGEKENGQHRTKETQGWESTLSHEHQAKQRQAESPSAETTQSKRAERSRETTALWIYGPCTQQEWTCPGLLLSDKNVALGVRGQGLYLPPQITLAPWEVLQPSVQCSTEATGTRRACCKNKIMLPERIDKH